MAAGLTDFLKVTENSFASIADEGVCAGDISGWIDSGSYAFNALLSGSIFGGFPLNKIVMIGSPNSTGKTFFALGAAKNFLDAHPTGIVICFESESATSKKMLIERGIDTKRFGVVPVNTVQEFKIQAIKIVTNYEKDKVKDRVPLLFILDSLGMLSTTKEMADAVAGSETKDMSRAGQIKAAFRVLTLMMGRANIPLIVTNHVYADVMGGIYASAVQSGGGGGLYAASAILTLSKAKDKEKDGSVSGAIITVTNTKSRLTRENNKIKCLIKYGGGLDRFYGLLPIAEACGVFKKISTKYELPDGTRVFGTRILRDPEKFFTTDVLNEIEKYVNITFCYGGGDEEGIEFTEGAGEDDVTDADMDEETAN